MGETGIRVLVKSYLFTIGHTGESQVELGDDRTVRALVDRIVEREPSLASVLKESGEERVLILRNGEKVNNLELVLRDGDKVVLLDGTFGG